jgi:hypothetical protein
MKALLIDPSNKTVTEIQIEKGIKAIYNAIGNGCTTFSCPITLDNEDTFYADDEGLFHEISGGIMMKDWSYPIVGKIVVLGTDKNGDSVDVKTKADDLAKLIFWQSKENCEKWAEQFN